MERTNYDSVILEAVAESVMPVGATHLAQKLHIPPANVGRTLARLEKQGFVEKVNNKGRCITPAGRSHLKESQDRKARIEAASEIIDMAQTADTDRLKEVLVARELLEGYTAMKCAENGSDELIAKLADLQYDYEYELRHGRSGGEKDLMLHLTIAEGSGNVILAQILQMILTEKKAYTGYARASVKDKANRVSIEEHNRIVKAISERDGELARKEMEAHLKRVRQSVEAQKETADLSEQRLHP